MTKDEDTSQRCADFIEVETLESSVVVRTQLTYRLKKGQSLAQLYAECLEDAVLQTEKLR
jgi:hypothetical protein